MLKDKRNPATRVSSQITIAAIGLALGIILLSLTYLIPFMDIFIIILVPFVSALVSLKGDYRAQLLFFFGSVAISFISWQEGIFQYLPNVVIGLVFGNVIKVFSTSFLTYLVTLTVSLLVESVLIYPINFLFSVDMISIYATVFGLSKEVFLPIFPLFYLLLSSIQTMIMFIIVSNELAKLGYIKQPRYNFDNIWIYFGLDLVFASLFIIGYYFVSWLGYLALGYSLLFLGYQAFKVLIPYDKTNTVLMSIIFVVSIVNFVVCISFLDIKQIYLGLVPGLLCMQAASLLLMKLHPPVQSFKTQKNIDTIVK